MLSIYDMLHLALLGVVAVLMLTGWLNFTILYLVVVAMIVLMLFRIMELESRPFESKAEKLKEAEKWDAVESKIQKVKEKLEARIKDIENRMTDDAVLEERLSKLYDRLTAIEEQIRENAARNSEMSLGMEKRLRRIELELGLADDIEVG